MAKTRVRSTLRLLTLLCLMIAGFGLVAGRLFWLQVMDSSRMSDMAAEQRLRTLTLPAHRGSILAADGSELAISMETQTVYASPREITNPAVAAQALAPVLAIDTAKLQGKLTGDSGFVYLARRQEPDVARQVADLDIPGVGLIPEPKRFYPSGPLAAQVLGFVGDENKGLAGLESSYDDVLTGRPGKAVTERDPAGRIIPVGESSVTEAVEGSDLVLTIDKQIQYEAEAALDRAVKKWKAHAGTVIVMSPETGNILAMANNPSFDPNDFSSSNAASRKNGAVVDVMEPGSVSKMVTAAAALESSVTTPTEVMRVDDELRIGAKTFKDSHPHPVQNMTFSQIIQSSSNVGTIKVAERLGKQSLHEYLGKFGYGRKTGLGFPGESAGILPDPDEWWQTSLGTIAIGQGVAVTPLQMARAYATLANDGIEMEPNLILATVDAEGRKHYAKGQQGRRVIQSSTARTLTEMLVGVTAGEDGTGSAAAISGYRVAGKTGTAQKPKIGAPGYSGYMASFVGFAPADNPELVVAVVLDDPQPFLAGETAAFTFKEVMEFSLRRLGADAAPGRLIQGPALAAPPAG
ncbi:MAG: penicillin-binding protein 2 [Actinomycetota bacterium]